MSIILKERNGDLMVTRVELLEMQQKNLNAIDKNQLVDIQNIKVNSKKPVNEKMEKYIKDTKNPYLFKVGDIAVKLTFNSAGDSFSHALIDAIKDNTSDTNTKNYY